MFKKLKKILAAMLTAIILPTNIVLAKEVQNNIFDNSNINKGIVSVGYSSSNDKKIKLMIEKDAVRYFYDIKDNNEESFPLQLGSGKYNIKVLENKDGDKYKVVKGQAVNVEIDNEKQVYLNSIQIINWNEDMEAIKKAKELVKGKTTSTEKVQAIYDYIVENVKYDYDKINHIESDYIPDINETFKSSNGICYDYSALFAAMTRSIGIPTKLVKGHRKEIDAYHAWNEVYLDDSDTWFTIDTTYDASLYNNNQEYSMIQDNSNYEKDKEY
ncbi:transglutaminase-like domain-containing protein [Clostridium ganghwense]|uniref:Transglutaminase-like domain-containing protein n=1 Tax=Clostridium ganghwense TaxID=312089 RepID=A0ABT4CQQ3_9CLOT|nr:transglutaminase-like domain-containing protein [Clostridium ganghwense]MCY6371364.1 transglutaminase-like domain-containing protein [Clostridium ganghwense]